MEESVGKPNVFLVQVSEPGSINILKNNKYKNDRWQSKPRDRAHGEVRVSDLLLIYFAGGAIDYQKQLKFVFKVTDVSNDNIEFRLERFEELNPLTLDQIRENVKKEILPDMFLNCGRQGFNICKIRHSDYEKIRQISEKLPSVSPMIGAENLLEDFVVNNWRPSEFFDRAFAQLEILKDKDGEITGQQYDTREVGIIDLLCIDKDTGDYMGIEIKKQKLETPRIGADYLAKITGHIKTDYLFEDIEVTANLYVKTETDSNDLSEWTSLRYILNIRNQLGIVHLSKFDFFWRDESPPLIWEWVAKAVHEFNLKKIRDRLGFMLGDYPPSGALGEWGSTYEFEAILKGLIAFGVDDIMIYKMRHVGESGFQFYSYAVLFFNRWIIFPHLAGTGSGGASMDLNYINQVIEDVKTQSRIHLIEFDIDYQDLVEKTKEYTPAFLVKKDLIESTSDEIKGVKLPEDIREKYLMEIEAISEAISKGYYPHALRDLRALIEDGGKYLCRLCNISLPEKATKKHIVSALVTNKIIEPRLNSWFDAFYTFGSKGAHGISLDDFDIIEKQKMVLMSLLLGKILLLEILRKIEERSSTNHTYRLPHPSQFSSLFNRR